MPTISFGARSFALIATGLALFALFALQEACPGQAPARREGSAVAGRASSPSQASVGTGDPRAAPLPTSAPCLLDFPPGADAPAGPYATRPRRPVRLATRLRASSATLLQATGGAGFHLDSPAVRGHGVRLHLTIAQSEEELVSLLLRGGDEGGADFIALSLERFVALLPELMPAVPKIFLLIANSRGADSLLARPGIAALGDLRGQRLAYGQADAGLYFLTWRLLKEGIAPDAVELRPAASPAEALRWLRAGLVDAALVHDLDLARDDGNPINGRGDSLPTLEEVLDSENGTAAMTEPTDGAPARGDSGDPLPQEGAPLRLNRLASTADAPRLVPQVLIGRGAFLVRYPEVARRTARALLAEAANAAEDPLPAARRLLEQVPTLLDPRASIRLDPPATLEENRAFFGLDDSASPLAYEDLFASLKRVLQKQGMAVAPGEASDFFFGMPLRKLSARSISSGRAAARKAAPARTALPVAEANDVAKSAAPDSAPTAEGEETDVSGPSAAPFPAPEDDDDSSQDEERGFEDGKLPLPDGTAAVPGTPVPTSPEDSPPESAPNDAL